MIAWLETAGSPHLLLDHAASLRLATLLFFAAMGSVWGSYLNVVVYRLPRGLSTAIPGSHCPRCATRIRPWQNVPVLSFLVLRGRCRACGGTISWRYPLVEAAAAAIFVAAGLRFGTWMEIVFAWCLGFVLLALALIDLDHRVLPERLTLPTLLLALCLQPFLGWAGPATALLAAAAGGLGMEALSRSWKRLAGTRGFGSGDAHLTALLAGAFGPEDALRALFLALLAAFCIGAPARSLGLLSRRRSSEGGGLPFGLFLGLAGLFVLLLDPVGAGR